MPLTFIIPGPLRDITGGEREITINSSAVNLNEALVVLWGHYPGLRDRILTEQGTVRQHMNIFVGDENIRYTGGLSTPVHNVEEIYIIPAVSGG